MMWPSNANKAILLKGYSKEMQLRSTKFIKILSLALIHIFLFPHLTSSLPLYSDSVSSLYPNLLTSLGEKNKLTSEFNALMDIAQNGCPDTTITPQNSSEPQWSLFNNCHSKEFCTSLYIKIYSPVQ